MSILKNELASVLNINELIIIPSGGGADTEFPHSKLRPKDFLKLAKENCASGNLIDAVSNAKRTIDCQVDEVLTVFNINLDKNTPLEKFIKDLGLNNHDSSYKLKVIESLGFAPTFLMSEARKIRHKLEHEYTKPSQEDTRKFLDIAELTIKSVEPLLGLFNKEFYITDKENNGKGPSHSLGFLIGLSVNFDETNKIFEVTVCKEDKKYKNVGISNSDYDYYVLIRLMSCMDDEHLGLETIQLAFK